MATKMDQIHDVFKSLSDKELLLDVRQPDEFKEFRIPGSRNIPHDQILQFADELKEYDKIYVYCRSGNRSQIATQMLASVDAANNVFLVDDVGMNYWRDQGYEIEEG
ncbi:MAG: hypothetical protein CL675_07255 [Bdellovibrionaceae bacterium]|nr:hypothetical protein [Pseudobdellovibrionaceae bacterium]|tara:strand:+ start:1098 stop:1418 length:321 start_codon:yes stop_codon:yes gene_type:complete